MLKDYSVYRCTESLPITNTTFSRYFIVSTYRYEIIFVIKRPLIKAVMELSVVSFRCLAQELLHTCVAVLY
jgi:hypothetical protein